jgi:radical SAM/Cys-rich protein
MVGLGAADPVVATDTTSAPAVEPFRSMLLRHGLRLDRAQTTTLQINVGLRCNQTCKHCHLDAGPGRTEMMGEATLDAVASVAARVPFEVIDITGGAPELNPHLPVMVEKLAPLTPRIMVRTNLSALEVVGLNRFLEIFEKHRVVLVASFPSSSPSQTDAQRGRGIFETSLRMMRMLNRNGYGMEDSGLELNLVSNPVGAFLPSSQSQLEARFHSLLKDKWSVAFNHLYTFANVPLGRFGKWLTASGNYERYMTRLVSSFNPCAVEGLMCRTLISVSWDGFLYDCDFNQARGLFMGSRRTHISELQGPPQAGVPIAVGDHCYTCTAGAGFT